MSLERRIEDLEKHAGNPDDFLLLVISFVGCNPAEIGEARAVRHPVTGYKVPGSDRQWTIQDDESPEQMKARMESELRAEGHRVFSVMECYAEKECVA